LRLSDYLSTGVRAKAWCLIHEDTRTLSRSVSLTLMCWLFGVSWPLVAAAPSRSPCRAPTAAPRRCSSTSRTTPVWTGRCGGGEIRAADPRGLVSFCALASALSYVLTPGPGMGTICRAPNRHITGTSAEAWCLLIHVESSLSSRQIPAVLGPLYEPASPRQLEGQPLHGQAGAPGGVTHACHLREHTQPRGVRSFLRAHLTWKGPCGAGSP